MRRLRAFVLTELLTAMLMQGLFIVVLCTSFYLLTSFYSNTQQVLTARAHAERVIAFFDDKIRHAGLGLWQCQSPADIRGRLRNFSEIWKRDYMLPAAIRVRTNHNKDEDSTSNPYISGNIFSGDLVVLLYAQRDLSTGDSAINLTIANSGTFTFNANATKAQDTLTMIDSNSANNLGDSDFDSLTNGSGEKNIKRYAVMEGAGFPISIQSRSGNNLTIQVFRNTTPAESITTPAAGELLYLKSIRMFVQNLNDGHGRQFAFRELKSEGSGWGTTYNQEKGILEIHMELDISTNVFTLYVMASGGLDYTHKADRPKNWPIYAKPKAEQWGTKVSNTEDYTDYPYHIIYVSRASWKLNNISEGFNWSRIK